MDNINVQGSKEWLANRKKYIGASDAVTIMGVSPWSTPYKLWQDKLSLCEAEESNFAMSRGNNLEPMARAAFEKETGLEMFPQVIYHPDHKFMMASLDGMTLDGNQIVEIKCPGKDNHLTALSGKVPAHYMPQLQHQLACSGLDMIWYYSFDGEKGVSIAVNRDNKYIEKMIEKEAEFWDCVENFIPPALTNKDYNNRDGALWSGCGNRLIEIDALMASLKLEKDIIRKELIIDAKDQSSKGGGITLTKTFPKGRVNYGLIPELEGLNLDKYRAETKETWTLRVRKKEA
jgi:putative phage-type endonuclease